VAAAAFLVARTANKMKKAQKSRPTTMKELSLR